MMFLVLGFVLMYISAMASRATDNSLNPSLLGQILISAGFIIGLILIVSGVISFF